MSTEQTTKPCLLQITGWILFIFSALFFIATSFRAGDMLGLTGGLLFLLACFVFLVPLIFQKSPDAVAKESRGQLDS